MNQYAWDVTSAWAGKIDRLLSTLPPAAAGATFLEMTPTVQALLFADLQMQHVQRITRSEAPLPWQAAGIPPLKPEALAHLLDARRAGYQKLEPVVLAQETSPVVALFFLTGEVDRLRLASLVLDSPAFIEDVIGPRLEDLARERFVLGIYRKGVQHAIYGTDDIPFSALRQQQALWLFPDYVVGIQLSGGGLEDVLRSRLRRDLGLIGLVALVLLVGMLIVYRNIRREVALAQLKSTFISNVSHELRTPLSLIRMYAESLELGRVSEARRPDYYRIIAQESERLTHLINNILNFSRIEAGQKDYHRIPTDLNAVVADVLNRYTLILQQQGFSVLCRFADDLPLVNGDDEAITEALLNLIDNAIKYSREEHVLELTTGRIDNQVFVEVADRGIGIAPVEQQNIFEPFYRISNGLTHDVKGTGLGLALVRHIMHAHHGTVTLQSHPGRGSRFRLVFPVAESSSFPSPSPHHHDADPHR